MFADLAGVTVWETTNCTEVEVHGELDLMALGWLRTALKVACADGVGDLVVDLERVSVCDRQVLGLLAVTSARLRAGGRRLIVRGNPPPQLRVFRLHGLEHRRTPV